MRNLSRPRVLSTLAAGAAVAVLLSGAHSANAQATQGLPSSKPLPSFAIRAGAYFPQNQLMKTDVGNTMIAGGADAVLDHFGPSDLSIVSLDYIDRQSSPNHLQMIPLTFGGIHYMDVKAQRREYIGYGVGAYFTSTEVTDRVGFQESYHTTLYGGYLNAGYEFNDYLFVDARYHFVQAVGPTNPGGLEVTAGVRF